MSTFAADRKFQVAKIGVVLRLIVEHKSEVVVVDGEARCEFADIVSL